MPPTDWSFEPTDVRDQEGRLVALPWTTQMDAPIAIDMAALLVEGETPSNVTSTLWRLKAYGEPDHVDVSSELTIPGDPVVAGPLVSQRVMGLSRGRVYRLYLTFGVTGSVRSRSVVIDVSDTG